MAEIVPRDPADDCAFDEIFGRRWRRTRDHGYRRDDRWLGGGAGCVIGHHEAAKHARERERAYQEGYGSSVPPSDRGYGPPP